MDLNVEKGVGALRGMPVGDRGPRYTDVFGKETNARHKGWLVRRVAWRLQSLAEGDLSERARQRAAELANDADLRTTVPRVKEPVPVALEGSEPPAPACRSDSRLPMPGTILTRDYKGQSLQVEGLAAGFGYAGQPYKSLRAVARAVTAAPCNALLLLM